MLDTVSDYDLKMLLKESKEHHEKLGNEMADVIAQVMRLADYYKIDLEKAYIEAREDGWSLFHKTDTVKKITIDGKSEFYAHSRISKNAKIIITDSDQKALELTNSNLKYCVNLNEDGEIVNYKISNGEYYVEGEKKEQLIAKNVKYGNFVDKINCNYELSDSDLLKEEVLSIEVNSKTMKIIEICGGVLVTIIVLFFLFRSKNER